MSHPMLIVTNIVGPGIVLFLASVLVSLYPAAKASKLDPAYAIRHA